MEFARGLQRAVAVDCEHEVGGGVVHQAVAFLPYMMLRFQQLRKGSRDNNQLPIAYIGRISYKIKDIFLKFAAINYIV